MSGYQTFQIMDLRLTLLRSLKDQPAYTANDRILQVEAQTFGLIQSRDVIRAELRWLSEVGAVSLKTAGSVMVATLTRRGHDHVAGLTVIEGVNRPSPEA